MKTFKLTNNDIVIKNFTFDITSSEEELIKQKIELRLKRFLGEWFLDVTKGLPFFESILKKNPDLNLINSLIKNEITQEATLTSFKSSVNTVTRKIEIDFEATTQLGDQVQVQIEV